MEYVNPSFEEICRTCLSLLQATDKHKNNSVFSEDIKEKFVNLTSFQLYENDGLPNCICTKCMELLDIAYSFKRKIEDSEEKLRKQLKTEQFTEPVYEDDSIGSNDFKEIPKIEPEEVEEYEEYKFDIDNKDFEFEHCRLPEVTEAAESSASDHVVIKTSSVSSVYEPAYQKFVKWCKEKRINDYSEDVLMTYFSELATNTNMKSSTLWAYYSMLKALLNSKHGIDINKYTKLRAYLKKQNENYIPKKTKIFTRDQFETFLFEACDIKYLAMKVVLIIGIFGACTREELTRMKIDDIEDLGSLLFVKIPGSKSSKKRTFTIIGEIFMNICRKYISLRPETENRRFFLKYSNGKCHRLVMGIHKVGSVPKEVAAYLKLPSWSEFTGHSLRQTSTVLLLEGGFNLKRYERWKSSGLAESYVEEYTDTKDFEIKMVLPNSNYETRNCGINNTESTVVSSDVTSTDSKFQTASIDSYFDSFQSMVPEVAEAVEPSVSDPAAIKSGGVYVAAYQKFMKWCEEKHVDGFSEDNLLAYFTELATNMKMKSSTLWAYYSMIKAVLLGKHGIYINEYTKLRAFLKKQNENYTPKKTKVFTKQQFESFLFEASDAKYLGMKVVMLFGVFGALRCEELINMEVDDIQDLGSLLFVKLPGNKTCKKRTFTIVGENFINIYRKYISLRPETKNRRFFLKYTNGKCHRLVMGINKMGSIAREVAAYLKLPSWKEYTGHSLRQTSAALFLDGGAAIRRGRSWKSGTLAEKYLEESLTDKDIEMKNLPNTNFDKNNSGRGDAESVIGNDTVKPANSITDTKTQIQTPINNYDNSIQRTSTEVAQTAETTVDDPVAIKSGSVYEAAYQKFIKWCEENHKNDYSEDVLMTYFFELANNLKMKSSTLWAYYSMLKALLNSKHGIDLNHYTKLRAYLKKQNENYIPKKTKVFTKEQFESFLFEASDVTYLGMKVVMLFGVFGALRCEELVNLKADDIEDLGSLLFVKIPGSTTSKKRTFTIVGEKFINIYRKYASLRLETDNRRFFIKYSNGKCHRSVMGINKMGSIARDVAAYLKLPSWKEYTGHSLRQTSAAILLDGEASLKRHGRWEFSSPSDNYLEESLSDNKDIEMKMELPNSSIELSNDSKCDAESTVVNDSVSPGGFTTDFSFQNTAISDYFDSAHCMLPEVAEAAESTANDHLSIKSGSIYEANYQKFMKWCEEKQVTEYSENVLLTYFSELAINLKMKSSTLWSYYSMIKSLLNSKHGVDINNYTKLRTFLKKQSKGYIPKRTKVFTREQFELFLYEAPDVKYLGMKVVMLFGIFGACRCEELINMKTDDIEDLGSLLFIKIPGCSTSKKRSFTIVGDHFIKIYRKYASLRPEGTKEQRFFLKYSNGKCHRLVMGIHKIGSIPKDVAAYLKLPNWNDFAGHSLRQTSAALLLDGRASLKRHGRWEFSNLTESYSEDCEESLNDNIDIEMKIELPTSEASNSSGGDAESTIVNDVSSDITFKNFNFQNALLTIVLFV